MDWSISKERYRQWGGGGTKSDRRFTPYVIYQASSPFLWDLYKGCGAVDLKVFLGCITGMEEGLLALHSAEMLAWCSVGVSGGI